MTDRWIPQEIEPKWQQRWEDEKLFTGSMDASRPKKYVLSMFPYPSGRIHMGHVRNYAIGDVVSRYRWKRGYKVLHPMGWDAFGLPAEQHAIKTGEHPGIVTDQNCDRFLAQLLGNLGHAPPE